MKKALYIIICISIFTTATTPAFSQTKKLTKAQKSVIADPTTWDGFEPGSPKAGISFDKKVCMGTKVGVLYIFQSPVTENLRTGNATVCPRKGSQIDGYIIKGGEVMPVTATVKFLGAPKLSGAMKALFNNGVNAVEVTTETTLTYSYYEPRKVTCYEVGTEDDYGTKSVTYYAVF